MVTCSTLSYLSCIFESFHTERSCKDPFRHLVVGHDWVTSTTFCDHMVCILPGSSVRGDSPGKSTGVGCHSFSRGSSRPRDQTQLSRIAGRFFTVWATRDFWAISSCLFLLSGLSGTSPLSLLSTAPPCRLDIFSCFLSDAMQLPRALSIWAQAHPEAHWELSFSQKFYKLLKKMSLSQEGESYSNCWEKQFLIFIFFHSLCILNSLSLPLKIMHR